MRDYIDAAAFKDMILCADAALHENIQKVNELNVFPVPDGDTGTNMGLTLNNAATELRKKNFVSLDAAADCVASALLRGARGNSGVILSLLFRGISRRLKGLESAGTVEFAGAMADGVEAAYKAVMKPAEGTILTVSRLAAAAAVEAANAGASLENALVCAIKAGDEALENTVNMNPVLKKAGVIDAGGMGYMIILKAMLASLRGEVTAPEEGGDFSSFAESSAFDVFDTEDITFAFDTVFIVRKKTPDVDLEPLRKYLSSIGDSLVIGDDDEAFKVHVHTDIPGNALTEAQKYGTLELAKIENMRTQYDAVAAGQKAQSTDDLDQIEQELEAGEEPEHAPAEKRYGFLAVCAGEGLATAFRDLGVDRIVSGGQTMNPSTEAILQEVNRTPSEVVFVLPNNKNIIMAAQQCVGLTDKEVIVVPTATVPQGIAAMMNADPDCEDPQALADAMTEAAAAVTTAQVTYAARNSDFDGFAISEGDYLALEDGKLFGTDRSIEPLLQKLAEDAAGRNAEFVTIFFGEDVTEEEAQKAEAVFTQACPDAEISVLSGGQPVYYYIVSIE